MKEKELDITVIIPVHELNETTEGLLLKALNSITAQDIKPSNVLVVTTEATRTKVEIFTSQFKQSVTTSIITNTGESDFCTQINLAVENVTTKYFSILEFDDEYSKTFFKNADIYMNSEEYKSCSMFLPLTVLVNTKGELIQFINEGVWAQGFSEVQGKLDLETSKNNNSFQISGAVIDKEAFIAAGGLKKDIKLFFIYEFLLRYMNNDNEVVVIPKIGYQHLIDREGSLFHQYTDANTGMTPEEVKFYLDTAKKEYFFNPNEIERSIVYTPAAIS
jgi:hypothetical protein